MIGTPRSLAALRWSPHEDAEAAGVLGQRGGDAVLGREVGDGGGGRRGGLLRRRLVPARVGQVLPQVVGEVAEPAQEPAVGGERGEPGGRDLPEQPHRVLARRGPHVRVHGPEEVPGLGVPGPAQVESQLVQRLELFGQDGADGESADCLHGVKRSLARWHDGASVGLFGIRSAY